MIISRLRGRGSVLMTWCAAGSNSKVGHEHTPYLMDLLVCMHHLVHILDDVVQPRANSIIRIKAALVCARS